MKKKLSLFFTMFASMFCMATVFAENTRGCDNVFGANVVLDTKIPNTVHLIILVIQIAVPVVLVIFGMLDLFKGIYASKDDEIKKAQQLFVKRLITAAIVFFVIAIVKLLFSVVSDDKDGNLMNCANCFLNGVKTDGTCN